MASRPIPPHGSEARRKGSKNRPPCNCRTCINGWSRAHQKRALSRLEGRPATIPAAPVTRHITGLLAANMNVRQIAAAAGTDLGTIRGHAAARWPAIRRTTAEKILAVRAGQQVDEGWVPALGAMRRCRALYTRGHGPKAIAAAHPDLHLRTVEYVCRGVRQHLTVAIDSAIREAYRTLSQTLGTSSQAKQRAAAEGWAGPEYWDDDEFDNPDFTPATELEMKRDQKAALRREEIEHLAWCGCDPAEIHARLNEEIDLSTIRQIAAEWRTGTRRQRTPERTAA
jgi:hypothetical protein